MKKKYVVSACLLGQKCKYNGESNYNERLDYFQDQSLVVPICPEVMSGLPTPRPPAEIKDNFVINNMGEDVTQYYIDGAQKTLSICKQLNIKKAILKERSPSCGYKQIYDGSFTHTLINGSGVTAQLLKQNGIKVYTEEDTPIYDAVVVCAGKSTRTHLKTNKVFESSLDSTCIESSVYPFLNDYMCNKVVIVANEDDIKFIEILFPYTKAIIVKGGNYREESVFNGLKKCSSKYVLIHDGARPYVSENLIDNIIDKLHSKCAIVPYISQDNASDYSKDGKFIQTPQAYQLDELIKYMNNIDLSKYRDESSIVSLHQDIEYIEGELTNKKITDILDVVEWRKHKNEDSL